MRYGNTDILKKEANGKELVTAKWVKDNYGVAPSPYMAWFSSNTVYIPYKNIRGLKWMKMNAYGKIVSTHIYTLSNFDCGTIYGGCYGEKEKYVYIDNITNFAIKCCQSSIYYGDYQCKYIVVQCKYNKETMLLTMQNINSKYIQSGQLWFSKDGKD